MTEIKDEEKNTIPEDEYHQSQLMDHIMNDQKAQVQTFIGEDPEKKETVRHFTLTREYEVFSAKGAESKISVDDYEKMPERLEKMESQEDSTSGKLVYTKDDVLKFIRAWCVNKVRATKDELCDLEKFMKMADFVEKLIFEQEHKYRTKPPKGINVTKMVSKSYVWESKKFMVKVGVETYLSLESKIRKLKKKAEKKDVFNLQAETEKTEFLQKNMRLQSGEYCSGAEFVAYFKELYTYMFPKSFGSEKGTEKDAEGVKELHPDQQTVEKNPVVKKKRGRPKKEGK